MWKHVRFSSCLLNKGKCFRGRSQELYGQQQNGGKLDL